MTKATGAPGRPVGADGLVASWDRVASWLRTHSPIDHAALRGPATGEEIAALETRLGFPLHPQLRALLELHDGAVPYPEHGVHRAGAFLPLGHRLSTADDIAAHHRWLGHLGTRIPDLPAVAGGSPEHARRWVECAHLDDGGVVLVDHRPGPSYGHVHEIGIASGPAGATNWAHTLAELFDKLANCLENRRAFMDHGAPVPYELPSGHHCVGWSPGSAPDEGGTPPWPEPRLPVPRVRPERRRGLGRPLGRLTLPMLYGGPAFFATGEPPFASVGPIGSSGLVPPARPEGGPDRSVSAQAQRAPSHSPDSLRAPGRSGE
ncbi:SMI1/KNR4 family protein [Streptomyces sp. NPDC008150]|uniref:SMI1/KNR4 family protein n=1 Tax=Streptomyces sp. NPDC008150 TaxID=3364816 RepID=UPI0036E7FC71